MLLRMIKTTYISNKNIYNISLSRKPVNAININILQELYNVIHNIKDSKISCIVFSTSLHHFSAGADLKERVNFNKIQTLKFLDDLNKLFNLIEGLYIPTIASINGACLGGGLELALACDFRICSADSIFSFPETSIGIIPGAGGTQRMSRLAGVSTAMKWIFASEKYTSEEALRDRVVDFVTPNKKLDIFTLDFAKKITKNAPLALKAAKSSILSTFIEEGFQNERLQYIKTLDSNDRNEGLISFAKKRTPKWNNS